MYTILLQILMKYINFTKFRDSIPETKHHVIGVSEETSFRFLDLYIYAKWLLVVYGGFIFRENYLFNVIITDTDILVHIY